MPGHERRHESRPSELTALIESGDLTDRLARQVLEGVIEGEGRPSEVVEKHGLKVVSDHGALIAATA